MVKIRADCAVHGPGAHLEPSHARMMMQRAARNSSGPRQLKQQRETRFNIKSEATQGKNEIKKNDQIRHQNTELQESSDPMDPSCDWMSLAARATRGSKAEYPSNSGSWNALTLDCFGPSHAPSVHDTLQIRSKQRQMVLKDTPRLIEFGLRFLVDHSCSLREHDILPLINHCFIVTVLFKYLDRLILDFDVLSRSSRKASDFTQWPQVMYPLWMRTLRRQRNTQG